MYVILCVQVELVWGDYIRWEKSYTLRGHVHPMAESSLILAIHNHGDIT